MSSGDDQWYSGPKVVSGHAQMSNINQENSDIKNMHWTINGIKAEHYQTHTRMNITN